MRCQLFGLVMCLVPALGQLNIGMHFIPCRIRTWDHVIPARGVISYQINGTWIIMAPTYERLYKYTAKTHFVITHIYILVRKMFIENLQYILITQSSIQILVAFILPCCIVCTLYNMCSTVYSYFEAWQILLTSFLYCCHSWLYYLYSHVCTCKPKLGNIYNIYRRNPFWSYIQQ